MRPTVLRPLLGVLSAIVVATLFLWEESRTLAAPLSAVHAALTELSHAESCEACHGKSGEGMTEACFECHEEVEAQFDGSSGFHAQLEGEARCGQCHSEHAGRGFALVSELSFAFAGYPSRSEYSHGGLGYELSGVHLELDCVECHELADAQQLAEGERRFQGLDQACASCHENEHEGEMQRACAACHGELRPFAELANFTHTEAFALADAHALDDCRECHARGSANSVEANASTLDEPRVRECAECHENNHAESFLAAAQNACLDCHPLTQAEFGVAFEDFDAERHAFADFELVAPHDEQECGDCHSGESFQQRYPGRARSDCVACHEDPHLDQFAGEGAKLACADCHFEERFVPARFDIQEHEDCGFVLEGSHAAVACFACHEAPETGPLSARTWRGLDAKCASCHVDVHVDKFSDEGLRMPESAADSTGCARCHQPTSFDLLLGEFDHELFTGFALDGAHTEAGCVACHTRTERDSNGRAFGRIDERYLELPSAEKPCVTCHSDPHEARFEDRVLPAKTERGRGCARCHTTSTWADLAGDDFDHELWTGEPLRGAHAELECEACHQQRALPDAHGRSFGRIADSFTGDPSRCETCHADPHYALFDSGHAPSIVGGRVGCARCHTEEEFAKVELAEYFHDQWTGTDLRRQHGVEVGCDDCHAPLTEPGWRGRGRAPAKGRTCTDCHLDEHAGQFGLDDRDRCLRCHAPGSSFEETLFDHQRDSVFALDEHHVGLECAQCHESYEVGAEKPLVRYKPLGHECADCHGVPETPGGSPR